MPFIHGAVVVLICGGGGDAVVANAVFFSRLILYEFVEILCIRHGFFSHCILY